jgi:PAS domain S-box-containing protein
MSLLRILHLEDSKADADIVHYVLKKSGLEFIIELVDNPYDYEFALKNYQPDIIISDHSLFQFDSLQALEIFKHSRLACPFILVTGTVSEEFAVSILKMGADDYLLKDNLVRLPHAITNSIKEKRTQKEKEIASESLRTLFKNIGEVFFSINPRDNRFLQISDACVTVYGVPRENFLANSELWLDVIHPEDAHVKSLLANAAKEPVEAEYRIVFPDGDFRWVQTKLVPEKKSWGETVRIDGITSDISSRKLAETNLASKIDELKTLMYRLSHDLRGPLASTTGLINVSKLEIKDPAALNYLEMIQRSNDKLDRILQGIVQLVKIDSFLDTKNKIDFESLISGIVQLYKYDAETQNINFSVSVNVESDFYCNEQFIHSVLYNLINNAVYYRKQSKPYVEVSVNEVMNEIHIEVKDNGMGISKEFQEKIFGMFFRATESSVGSGLGLYIVKNIVDKLNGKIYLESEPGVGSKFTVILPK